MALGVFRVVGGALVGFGFGGAALPTSVLYSGDGKEIARVIGAPDWEGAEMRALLEEAVNE